MSTPSVSAIIVTYHSLSFIGDCLDSIQFSARDWLKECIVVDNASGDGITEMLQARYPWVTVIANRDNVGFGRAMNQGAKLATGDALFIVNPDTKIEPGAIEELALFLQHRPQAGACGPKIVNPQGEFHRASRRGFPTPLNALGYLLRLDRVFPGNPRLGGYHRRDISEDLEMVTDSLSGSCMMARRTVFEEVGGFDEDYFLFGEDIDLCWKIKQAGHEIWYIPSSRVVHVKGASMKHEPELAKQEFYHSMRIFMDKRLQEQYSRWVLWAAKAGVSLAEMCSRRFHKSAEAQSRAD